MGEYWVLEWINTNDRQGQSRKHDKSGKGEERSRKFERNKGKNRRGQLELECEIV